MLIIRLLINALALLTVAKIVPGIYISSLPAAIVVAIVLGLVNAILRPLLILISLPLEILTLGLFTFVINGALLLLVAHLNIGLEISGWGAAIIGAIVLSSYHFSCHFYSKQSKPSRVCP